MEKGFNFSKILYDPRKDCWLTPVTDPTKVQVFDKELISEMLLIEDIDSILNSIDEDRVIIQYKALLHKKSNLNFKHQQDVHAAVLQKTDAGWWLLDSFEHCPINLRDDKAYARDWLGDIQELMIIKMKEEKGSKAEK